MPMPEGSALVINCANSVQRSNQSWVLDRLLQDHEIAHPADRAIVSMRIDVFELAPLEVSKPDLVWWIGWATILAQTALTVAPWVLYGDWGTMLVVICGSLLALVQSSLPQWKEGKWSGANLKSDSLIVLTRRNGHKHVMILIGSKGCPDLQVYATATVDGHSQTASLCLVLATLWLCLLLSVSGLQSDAWFLVGIGGLGMLQNVYAAGTTKHKSATGF